MQPLDLGIARHHRPMDPVHRGRVQWLPRSFSKGSKAMLSIRSVLMAAITLLVAAGSFAQDTTIRPFRAQIPETAVADLRQRLVSTRWPDRETVADRSHGAQLEKLQDLVRYWGTAYDWRKAEAK